MSEDSQDIVTIKIAGIEYQLYCPQEEQSSLIEAGEILDKRIKSIKRKTRNLPIEKVAVLAGLDDVNEFTSDDTIELYAKHCIPFKRGYLLYGPPGTGKSKTITAVLNYALSKGQKCLMVSEKKTAMEVIYQNLNRLGISEYVAKITDINESVAKDAFVMPSNTRSYSAGLLPFDKALEFSSTNSE